MIDWNAELKDMDFQEDGVKYMNCMVMIINRTNLIKEYLEDKANLDKDRIQITIEFICLQYRKIFELIIMASLAANRKDVSAQYLHILNEYNPDRMVKIMKKINPDYYPIPCRIKLIYGIPTVKQLPITEKHLSESDLISAWKYCSDFLHARNPYKKLIGKKQILENFQTWWDKIQGLLFTHCIKLKRKHVYLLVDAPFYDVTKVKASVVAMNP